ncbi:unnamed protein product [Rodentolepis nana]|uniref:SRP40_C domain-containing protein n=1 Tax=Rodentolepis nana TaxID=102285 RepID=A0A0R3TIK8_RODNA|nr:unnamed protein product [Rodentolepis nana]
MLQIKNKGKGRKINDASRSDISYVDKSPASNPLKRRSDTNNNNPHKKTNVKDKQQGNISRDLKFDSDLNERTREMETSINVPRKRSLNTSRRDAAWKKPVVQQQQQKKKDSSSSSDSSSDSSSEDEAPAKKPIVGAGVKTPVAAATTKKPVVQQQQQKKKDSSSSSDSFSDSSSEVETSLDSNAHSHKLPAGKRPRSCDSSLNSAPPLKMAAVDIASVTDVTNTSMVSRNGKRFADDDPSISSSIPFKKSKSDSGGYSASRKSLPSRWSNGDGDTSTPKRNAPFLRYANRAPESVHLFKGDNFHARRQLLGEVGERADRNLLGTRGRSFRHEKTKEKRGTRSNGPISTKVASYQFQY